MESHEERDIAPPALEELTATELEEVTGARDGDGQRDGVAEEAEEPGNEDDDDDDEEEEEDRVHAHTARPPYGQAAHLATSSTQHRCNCPRLGLCGPPGRNSAINRPLRS